MIQEPASDPKLGATTESMKELIRQLMDRLDGHITDTQKRYTHFDTLAKELKIYNRGGLPGWLTPALVAMGCAHLGTLIVLIYLFQHHS